MVKVLLAGGAPALAAALPAAASPAATAMLAGPDGESPRSRRTMKESQPTSGAAGGAPQPAETGCAQQDSAKVTFVGEVQGVPRKLNSDPVKVCAGGL